MHTSESNGASGDPIAAPLICLKYRLLNCSVVFLVVQIALIALRLLSLLSDCSHIALIALRLLSHCSQTYA